MIGKTILHYKILEKLGEGGMGVVYKAQDTKLERTVALKFLSAHSLGGEDEIERFKREAKAAAALNHPNIATIYAIEEHDEELFIVMEYIDGKELREVVGAYRNTPLPVNQILNYAAQIAAGLQAAHKKDVVHRDIKSANIMITQDNQVKIMDFGLAKIKGGPHMTRVGSTLGTPYYMSPEQARGDEVDARTDIWSFGVVLYEMLTGQLPFQGEYEQAVIYAILNEKPTPLTNITPDVPVDFQTIVDKALTKDPDQRYQNADEMAGDLRAITDGHPVKGKSIGKRSKMLWLIAAVIIVLTVTGIYFFKPGSPSSKLAVKTIAVLPFVNMSSDLDQEYFSDGLTEELLNVLAKNPRLQVTSRTSAFSFKGTKADIRTIAAKLNVKHILEGSVRKSGNILRITTQLIDVDKDAHLWSETYDRKFDDIFAVQESISRSVAEALNITLLGGGQNPSLRKTKPEAYNAYLRGEHLIKLGTVESLEKAVTYFEQALAIDPGYAPAWSGLSAVRTVQADFGYLPVEKNYTQARREAEKALKLDPNLASALAGIGWINLSYDWDWSGADAAYRRARELEPGNAEVLRGAASLAATLGRLSEAIELSRRAIELDPINTATLFNLGLYNYYAGFLEEAENALKKTREMNPRFPLIHSFIGQLYLAAGKPDSALVEITMETEGLWHSFGLVLAYHDLGRKNEADSVLAKLIIEFQDEGAYQIAELYAYRGELDQAFAWLERAYQQRDGGLAEIKGDPLLRGIEKDPRYTAFIKKMKLPL